MGVLAGAEQMPRGVEEPRRADILVGVDGGSDPGEAARTAQRVGRQLGAAYPGRQAIVLLLSESANEPATPGPLLESSAVPLVAWNHPGQSAIEAMLRATEKYEAGACALVAPDSEDAPTTSASRLLAPVVEDGMDFACPTYVTHRFDGVVNTGIVHPVMRALFGKRLRQPFGKELALSRTVATHLLGEAWLADPSHAGDRIWLATSVLAGDYQVCQVQLGAPPPRLAEANADLAASLAQVMGLLFHEMRVHAGAWQRVKGSRPVKTYGTSDGLAPEGEARQPQIGPLVSAFQLGYQELGRLWAMVLPPQTLLAMKRLSRAPEDAFGFDDALWARIVYDFAVGYHLATMERPLLLRSMTPLYLGWAAGFVREVRDLDPAQVEARIERLCRAFETTKPYLISRWRWPDRFNP